MSVVIINPNQVVEHNLLSLVVSMLTHQKNFHTRAEAVENTSVSPYNTTLCPDDLLALNIIGRSMAILSALKNLKKIAVCEAPVVIEGETGTGKEVVARAIHNLSPRKNHAFVPVNCGALPESLLERELFGHEKGAFTDAKQTRSGVIEQANNGTLFLDEVDTLSPKAQVSLLRFLQEQEYRPLGGEKIIAANVRILTASNANLHNLVHEGLYRQDLVYRLNVMCIHLPPLRERLGDIELLSAHFLDKYQQRYNMTNKYIDSETIEKMCSYTWPGNIRELENLIHRELILSENNRVLINFSQYTAMERRRSFLDRRTFNYQGKDFKQAKKEAIEAFESHYLTWIMNEVGGSVTLAATKSGKERSALGKLLKKYNIDKTLFKNIK